jgi:putative ABC transport system permease protein
MQTIWQDIKYGIRVLWKSPGFTLVAILVTALGIGANTAIFSVVNAVLLRPLPFPQSEQLMTVWETNQARGLMQSAVSYPDFADWRAQNHVFERMASYHTNDFTLTGNAEPQRLQGAVVNADLFPLLGAQAQLGRTFRPEEDQPGDSGSVVVLSHRLWQQRFNSDPNVVGRAVTLDGQSYTVIGVMPAGFQFPVQNEPVELWTSVSGDASGAEPITSQRGAHYMYVIGRLKPGVTRAQAQAELDTIASRLAQLDPDHNKNRGVYVQPALEGLVGDIRPALLILLGAVGFVLLIACANVANLLLARATTRHKEIAIRSALGASRWRVVQQLLTESLLLAFVGGALGLLVALWGTDLLVKLNSTDIPRVAQTGLDMRSLGFTLVVSLLTGVLFGLVPALQASKSDLNETLKEGGRSAGTGARRNHVRNTLIVAEVAIAVVLLVGAGLLIQSLRRLQHVNPGFDPANVLTLNVGLPDVKYTSQQQASFYRNLHERIEALPGVVSASAIYPVPLGGDRIGVSFETEGRPVPKSDEPVLEFRVVNPDYFRTMSIPLVKGRDFTARDDKQATPVIIVNEAFAQKFFPGEDPLGKRIKPGIATDETKPVMREIIGVVGDVKHKSLSASADPEGYVPEAQIPFDTMTLVVKTSVPAESITSAVRNEVYALDKDLPVYTVKTMDNYLAASVAQPRFNTLLLALFAGLALVLTVVGLYGVMSYAVVQRTHEMGIRLALGAQTRDIFKLVIGQGMLLALVGVGLGLIGAFALTRIMASLLFGVRATDPLTFGTVSVLMIGVALLACYVPARRATRVDPMVALRYE